MVGYDEKKRKTSRSHKLNSNYSSFLFLFVVVLNRTVLTLMNTCFVILVLLLLLVLLRADDENAVTFVRDGEAAHRTPRHTLLQFEILGGGVEQVERAGRQNEHPLSLFQPVAVVLRHRDAVLNTYVDRHGQNGQNDDLVHV